MVAVPLSFIFMDATMSEIPENYNFFLILTGHQSLCLLSVCGWPVILIKEIIREVREGTWMSHTYFLATNAWSLWPYERGGTENEWRIWLSGHSVSKRQSFAIPCVDSQLMSGVATFACRERLGANSDVHFSFFLFLGISANL